MKISDISAWLSVVRKFQLINKEVDRVADKKKKAETKPSFKIKGF